MDDRAASSHETLARQMRRAARQLRSAAFAAEAKYNPNWAAQPRIPAGDPGGGRWTNGGGRSQGAPSRGQQRRILPARQGDSSASWRLLRRKALVDGTGERTLHRADDGTKILTERRAGLVTGARTSRHVVQMPDGGSLLVDNDRHGVQRIQGADGALISASRWGPNGPEPVAVAQPAHDTSVRPGRTIAVPLPPNLAAIALFNQIVASELRGQPVISFRAQEYQPASDGSYSLEFVGEITTEQADEACKKYPEVRENLTRIAREVRVGFRGSPQQFGTAVHRRMKEYVNSQDNQNFVAEQSFDETGKKPYYSKKGSSRLDI